MSQIDYVRREEQFTVVESMARRARVPWDRRCRVGRGEANPPSLVGARSPRSTRRHRQRPCVVGAKPTLVKLDDSTRVVHNHAQAVYDRTPPKEGASQ